ncbi:MAG: phenylalanine--tRNA ligase subunit alpha [Chloroflexi bacterium]|nr:phenylalanine--tRNA ligase subunit alpha [Chloroflexota bacterium]
MVEHTNIIEQLAELGRAAEAGLAGAPDAAALEEWRVRYLGRHGALGALMEQMGALPKEERPAAGREANRVKNLLESGYGARAQELQQARLLGNLAAERIDVTMPGRTPAVGYPHPLRETLEEIIRVFADMGFTAVEGPEVEWERYNFELLNIPADHPARDTMDTLYVDQKLGILLRTHTSPMQARTMLAQRPPVRIIVPGQCYRRENEDATHLVDFSQVEGLAVDTDITFADLKGTLALFARRMFDARARFRPHHFQFTEPSAEMDVTCPVCGGKGCRVCKFEGWVELLGCGMVHPRVLRMVGYDPAVYSGFAFGLGIERAAFFKYGVPDLRLFYGNDLRFLEQARLEGAR